MVDTPKEGSDDNEKNTVEHKPPEIQPSADVSNAALNHAVEKIAIPTRETTILRTTPKTKKTPSSQPPNRTIGKMGKLALMNRL